MSLADDAAARLNDDGNWETRERGRRAAQAMALVSIAQSLEELVAVKRHELEAIYEGGLYDRDLFDHVAREVVDTGPLPGGQP